MEVFIVVFVAMLMVVAAMAVGVMLGRKPIAGSCGGMSALGLKTACEICGGDDSKCENSNGTTADQKKAKDLAYDAASTNQA